MSDTIDQAFVSDFSDTLMHLAQQKGSILRGNGIRERQVKGEVAYFDRLGTAAAVKRTVRHGDTVLLNPPHSRRRAELEVHDWAVMLDKPDDVKTLIDPTNPYVESGRNSLGRAMDDVIITAASAAATEGKSGGTSVAYVATQRIGAHDNSSTTGSPLNVRTLRATKKKFGKNEVKGEKLYFAHTSEQTDDLLGETEVTSSDYNTVKALVNGELNDDMFMGFKFIETERLAVNASAFTYDKATGETDGADDATLPANGGRICLAWAEGGLGLAMGYEINTTIGPRADKNNDTQVHSSLMLGAVRVEDVRVIEVYCDE